MVIDATTITVQRTGHTATLLVQGRPIGLSVTITLAQLDQLIHELAQNARVWRASIQPDFYSVLGVPRDATTAEIKRAFRNLAKRHHPDVHQHGEHAEMATVNEAYETLKDPEKRTHYDQQFS
jgi:DnaJ-domain-containing protein 1